MKKNILYILLFLSISFLAKGQTSPCFLFDATSIDQLKQIKTNFYSIKQTGKAIHDTTATDLLLVVKDFDTSKPLNDVSADLTAKIFKVSDSTGRINFNAFGTGSIYTLLISKKNYHCLEIRNLHFGSGEIRWLEIKLKKAN